MQTLTKTKSITNTKLAIATLSALAVGGIAFFFFPPTDFIQNMYELEESSRRGVEEFFFAEERPLDERESEESNRGDTEEFAVREDDSRGGGGSGEVVTHYTNARIWGDKVVAIGHRDEENFVILYDISTDEKKVIDTGGKYNFVDISGKKVMYIKKVTVEKKKLITPPPGPTSTPPYYVTYHEGYGELFLYDIEYEYQFSIGHALNGESTKARVADNGVLYERHDGKLIFYEMGIGTHHVLNYVTNSSIENKLAFSDYNAMSLAVEAKPTGFILSNKFLAVSTHLNAKIPPTTNWSKIFSNAATFTFKDLEIDKKYTVWVEDETVYNGVLRVLDNNKKTVVLNIEPNVYTGPKKEMISGADIYTFNIGKEYFVGRTAFNTDGYRVVYNINSKQDLNDIRLYEKQPSQLSGSKKTIYSSKKPVTEPRIHGDYVIWAEKANTNPNYYAHIHLLDLSSNKHSVILN